MKGCPVLSQGVAEQGHAAQRRGGAGQEGIAIMPYEEPGAFYNCGRRREELNRHTPPEPLQAAPVNAGPHVVGLDVEPKSSLPGSARAVPAPTLLPTGCGIWQLHTICSVTCTLGRISCNSHAPAHTLGGCIYLNKRTQGSARLVWFSELRISL